MADDRTTGSDITRRVARQGRAESLTSGRVAVFAVPLALGAAFIEHGDNLLLLAGIQAVAVLWLTHHLWVAYPGGFEWRPAALPLALLLFWVWLGLGILLSPVRSVATITFWIVGSVPLFCAIVLIQRRFSIESVWRKVGSVLLLVAAVVGIYGIWQRVGLLEQGRFLFLNPRSYEAFLNLLLLPAVALLLHDLTQPGCAKRRRFYALGTLVVTVVYALAANGGRGAGLGLWIGLGVLLLLSRRLVSGRAMALVCALVLTVHGFAALTVPNSVSRAGAGLGSAAEEALALAARTTGFGVSDKERYGQRLLIWRSSLALLHRRPWYGAGPGTFWLAYRPYRSPLDGSAGQHAHNDYLEFLIELGWPGLALLLVVMGFAARTALQAVRNVYLEDLQRVEAAGLLAGLSAIAVHSLFSFNFYVLPILIVMGLYLGRLQLLADAGHELRVWRPARWVGRPAYRLIILGLAAIPLSQLAGIAAADAWVRQANHEMARGEFEAARTHLWRAFNAFETDRPLLELARIYTRGVRTTSDPAARRKFLEAGKKVLDQAREVNPLRAYTPLLRAGLIETAGPALDPAWERPAARAYRRALALDPRQWMARRGLAESLLRGNRRGEAVHLVEDGLRYTPLAERGALPFYGLAVRLRMERGDSAGAAEVYQDMKRIARESHLTQESLAAFGIKTWLPALEALSGKADSS